MVFTALLAEQVEASSDDPKTVERVFLWYTAALNGGPRHLNVPRALPVHPGRLQAVRGQGGGDCVLLLLWGGDSVVSPRACVVLDPKKEVC